MHQRDGRGTTASVIVQAEPAQTENTRYFPSAGPIWPSEECKVTGEGLGLPGQELEPDASPLLAGREELRECLAVPAFRSCPAEARQLGESQPQLAPNLPGIQMQAKYFSTNNMLDDEWGTTLSLHSHTSTPSPRPKQGHPEKPPPSSAWRPVALILIILCLVLLIGLAILGFVFFQFYQLSNTQKDSINKLEERSGNLSQRLQSLQAQNRKLMETLQQVAKKYCRELYNKTGEHRCSPCPENWKWHGDKCYQFYKKSKSWQDCDFFCTAENSTMLKIKTQEVLQFAMPQSYSEFFYSYWIGLSRNDSDKAWLWVDGAPYTSELFKIKTDFTSPGDGDCVTILSGMFFSKNCQELRRCACETTATPVKLERLP